MIPDNEHNITIESMLFDYAAGNLSEIDRLIIMGYIQLNPNIQKHIDELNEMGSQIIESMPPIALSQKCLEKTLKQLDNPIDTIECDSNYDDLLHILNGNYPPEKQWHSVFSNILKCDLKKCPITHKTIRLTQQPPGAVTPRHCHKGTEITLVIDGGFEDENGQFRKGDIEIISNTQQYHTPTACSKNGCTTISIICSPVSFEQRSLRFLNLFKRF